MHKSGLKANLTLINDIIMVYKFRAETTGSQMSIGSLKIRYWSWFNIPLKRINYTPIPYVNNNKTRLMSVTYYPLHVDST